MNSPEPTWLDYVTAFGSVATPLLFIGLSALAWRVRARFERAVELENKLRDDRIEIYNKILEPFVIILMTDTAWNSDKRNRGKDKGDVAIGTMLSLEYRRLGFRMSLMGSDAVVRSYNELMQYFYTRTEQNTGDEKQFVFEMLHLIGTFLLEIRRSMGNQDTKLDSLDMCEWWMSDARKYRNYGVST